MPEILFELENLTKSYQKKQRREQEAVFAVNGVDLTIYQGETLGLVGESGSGKTTLGRLVLEMEALTAGTIRYQGQDVATLSKEKRKAWRQAMQVIFQDPYSALNPRMTALELVREPLLKQYSRDEANRRASELLEEVGLPVAVQGKYPKAFSGGQRQRIGIARAVATRPQFIVCDEPTSALDVSIQAQIMNLFADLKKQYALTYLFISHDLSIIRHVSDRIAVMYHGFLVELGPAEDLFQQPQHPYTQKLLAAIPKLVGETETEQAQAPERDQSFTVTAGDAWVEVTPGHFVRQAKEEK